MRKMLWRALILFWIFVVLAGQGFTQKQKPGARENSPLLSPSAQVDLLFADRDNRQKPGASVAVVRDGTVLLQKGYGSANLEYGLPVTTSTLFQVASVSKQFTAFAVLLLEEEGKVSMGDDIRKYIPEVPHFGKVITLRHLAWHTSGLRDQWSLLALGGWRLDDVITREHILRLISWQKELNFDPGEKYLYSNTGYTLLAEVVSRVSGMPFTEFTRRRIFEPLGMKHTFFCEDHEQVIRNRAYSYYPEEEIYKKSVLNYSIAGATSLFTTVEDLILWVSNFGEPRVGNRHMIRKMRERGVLNSGEPVNYAMGQIIGTYRGWDMISHSGSDAGFQAFLARIPEHHFAVMVLSNDASINAVATGQRIADIYLRPVGRRQPISDRQGWRRSGQGDGKPEPEGPIVLPHDKLASYCGNYWNEEDAYLVRVCLREDTLRYLLSENYERAIIPVGANEFKMLGLSDDIRLFFKHISHQERWMEMSVNGRPPVILNAYFPIDYTPDKLNRFVGTYFSPELASWYRLERSGDRLVAVHRRHRDILLEPFGIDLFQGEAWFFRKVQFIRDANGRVKGFNVSSRRVKDLWFEKLGS